MQISNLIELKTADAIGIMTICNPPQNRIEDPEFIDLETLKMWTDENSLKGLIITGKGRHFSAGANTQKINEKVTQDQMMVEDLKKGRKILDHIERLPIPTVASISGVCFGAGLEIALACHIRVCSENSLLAFPESNLGLLPGLSGTFRLSRQIGAGRSMELILSGKTITACEALEMSIVDYIAPKKKGLKFAIDLLKKITADKPLHVIHAITQSLNNSKFLLPDDAMEEESKLFCQLALKVAQENR